MKYTYLLLHPSTNLYVEKVFDILNQSNITVMAVYRIPGWDTILKTIYKNTFMKSSTVEEHVIAHAYINKYFFGNCGLLLLLYKNIPYHDLIKETIDVKLRFRQEMSETKEGIITIVLDTNRSIYNSNQKELNGYSKIEKPSPKNTLKIFLSYIHCPDTVEQYEEDFETFRIFLRNKLTANEIEKIIKYRSFFY